MKCALRLFECRTRPASSTAAHVALVEFVYLWALKLHRHTSSGRVDYLWIKQSVHMRVRDRGGGGTAMNTLGRATYTSSTAPQSPVT